jgi:branched-chain amino acid transport system substrate-binding protein
VDRSRGRSLAVGAAARGCGQGRQPGCQRVGTNGVDLVKGLQSLKGDTLDGWAPPLTFAANQPHPVDCWFTTEVKNGRFQMPLGLKTTCSNS